MYRCSCGRIQEDPGGSRRELEYLERSCGGWKVLEGLDSPKIPGVFASFVTFLKGETFTWMVWKALGVSRSGS